MHNACTVAGMLTNCETWVLDKGERQKLERIELWALKKALKALKNPGNLVHNGYAYHVHTR